MSGINLGYVINQLARALQGGSTALSGKWSQVLDGIGSGRLSIGSRTPVGDVPPWATLEVVKGGFATGGLAAGGALRSHEAKPRAALNLEAASDEGRARLRELLRSGAYAIEVPEEAALLVLAVLVERQEAERAAALLAEIAPFFDRLRFYPVPAEPSSTRVDRLFRSSAHEVAAALRAKRQSPRIVRMNESLTAGAEHRERVVALLLETVEGAPPRLIETGAPRVGANVGFRVEGGVPGTHISAEWRERAKQALANQPRTGGSLRELVSHLEALVEGKADQRSTAKLRRLLAGEVRKRGLPGSPERARLRAVQTQTAARPTHSTLRSIVADRLSELPSNRGVASIQEVMQPALGFAMPPSLADAVARCLEGTVDELVAAGVITSGEVLANMLPRVVSRLRASAFDDAEIGRLYALTYDAFRRRRSLLLLNLEGQVKFEELPWVRALEPLRPRRPATSGEAADALASAASLALAAFPQTLIPNKLITELRALARSAEYDLVLIEELAADIFQGAFGGGFVKAGHAAARRLTGSLYARYYGVPYERVARIEDLAKKPGHAASSSPVFFELCNELAGRPERRSVAANGMVLEQQQIVTTQNLAALFEVPGVEAALAGELASMARTCFKWMLWQLRGRRAPERAKVKNVAYAWRQAVFFITLAGESAQAEFVAWADNAARTQRGVYQRRLIRAVDGLKLAIAGEDPGAMRLLGWSTTPHWLWRAE